MSRTLLAGLSFTVLSAATLAAAQDEGEAVIDPRKAGVEFALQGEYSGLLDDETWGVQVIALGDGRFRAVGYEGGLPGDGWNGEDAVTAEAELKEGEVHFRSDEADARLKKDGTLTIVADGEQIGTLKKVDRQSPTLGKKPPKGAVVLFGGKKEDAENWRGGMVTEDGLLTQGVTSKQTFAEPFTLHMEFLLSFMPHARGQARSNSGVYLQGRHEVQILDSFGLEGKSNECGGIYSLAEPDVNMCFPPLSWQTYDIEYTPAQFDNGEKTANARMTVLHNGVKIHDDVEVPEATRAAPIKEGAEGGPIYIQNHGNPLRFRNIWVLPKQG